MGLPASRGAIDAEFASAAALDDPALRVGYGQAVVAEVEAGVAEVEAGVAGVAAE